MKKLIECCEYDGGDVKAHHLYVSGSKDIILTGKVNFSVFGTVRMNGVKISDTSVYVELSKPTVFDVQKDSAILFNQVPVPYVEREMPIPVEDVPDYGDLARQQMYNMFDEWMASKGVEIQQPEVEDVEPGVDDFDLEDEEEYDYKLDIDQESLIEGPGELSKDVSLMTGTEEEKSDDVVKLEDSNPDDDRNDVDTRDRRGSGGGKPPDASVASLPNGGLLSEREHSSSEAV